MPYHPIGTVQSRHSDRDLQSYKLSQKTFAECKLSLFERLDAFPRFCSKRALTRFMSRFEIYKNILHVNGVVIECGVLNGTGLFTWAQFANILEPINFTRKIIGFDTFEGYPSVSNEDINPVKSPKSGDLKGDSYEAIVASIEKYNFERPMGHIPNVELIKGNFLETAEAYISNNPHLLVALLHINFDLYEPTKKALELFLPRMAKGSIICLGYLNCSNAPGESVALLELLKLRDIAIRRFHYDPWISYIKL